MKTTSEPQVLRIPEAMRRLPRVGCGAIGLVQMIEVLMLLCAERICRNLYEVCPCIFRRLFQEQIATLAEALHWETVCDMGVDT